MKILSQDEQSIGIFELLQITNIAGEFQIFGCLRSGNVTTLGEYDSLKKAIFVFKEILTYHNDYYIMPKNKDLNVY